MKIIITGGKGFIGSHLIKALEKKTDVDKIYCLNRSFSPLEADGDESRHIVNYHIDLTHYNDVLYLMKKISPNIIFHLAAKATVREDEDNPTKISYDNYISTHNLLASCPHLTKFIYASSVLVHGNCNFETEDDTIGTSPSSVYGVTKKASEDLIRVYHLQGKIAGKILRLTATVGSKCTHGLLFDIIRKLKSNSKHLELLGDSPGSIKPYTYVQDVISAFLLAGFENGKWFDIYNVSNNSISVETVAKIAMDTCKIHKPIKWLGERANWKGDNKYISAKSELMKRIGWEKQCGSSEKAVQRAVFDIMSDK